VLVQGETIVALLALSYPSISEANWKWIQNLRQQHDPNYTVVAPHFTLVFPTLERERQSFSEHVRAHLRGQPPISITLRCAIVVKDLLNEHTHTFLVPDQGFSDLVKLHDQLYTGFLADQLRLDIPYIPHINVASSLDATLCKRVADEINSQKLCIPGFIRIIDIVQYAKRTVTTLEQISLE
jgi:hypothetical protein